MPTRRSKDVPPPVQFLSFSCIFRQKSYQIIGFRSKIRHSPPSRKSWICHSRLHTLCEGHLEKRVVFGKNHWCKGISCAYLNLSRGTGVNDYEPQPEWPDRRFPESLFSFSATYICRCPGVLGLQVCGEGWGSLGTDWGADRAPRGNARPRHEARSVVTHLRQKLRLGIQAAWVLNFLRFRPEIGLCCPFPNTTVNLDLPLVRCDKPIWPWLLALVV